MRQNESIEPPPRKRRKLEEFGVAEDYLAYFDNAATSVMLLEHRFVEILIFHSQEMFMKL